MKKEIKKFWQGKISLGRSFWLWYFVGGTVITLPGFLVPDSALVETDSTVIIFILYVVFMLVAIIFLMIGSYKSAQEYKKIKRKKKQGSGWGTAAQVYIILSAIRGFVEMIKIFQS